MALGVFLLGVGCAPAANSPAVSGDSGRSGPSECSHTIRWHTKFEAPSTLPWPLSGTDDLSAATRRRTRAIDVYEANDKAIVYLEHDEVVSSSSGSQQVRCAPGISGPCYHNAAWNNYRRTLVAYDATARELWHTPVREAGKWAVAGRWIVDASTPDVHVYDAVTGALARTTDAIAGDVCVSQDGIAWIQDRVGLDPETGSLRARSDGEPCPSGVTRAIVSGMTDCASAEVGIDDAFSYRWSEALVTAPSPPGSSGHRADGWSPSSIRASGGYERGRLSRSNIQSRARRGEWPIWLTAG
jgi:hypothetical protein